MSAIPYMEPGGAVSPASHKLYYAVAERNGPVILERLRELLPEPVAGTLDVLEIGSGSGQHVTMFARGLPHTRWQPTDVEDVALASVREYVREAGLEARVHEPLLLDGARDFAEQLGGRQFDAMLAVNVVHIVPWEVAVGLIRGAANVLRPGGLLLFYGSFARDGVLEPESNVKFDADLRQRNPAWGVRDTRDLAAEATRHGLEMSAVHAMPNNNFVVQIVQRRS